MIFPIEIYDYIISLSNLQTALSLHNNYAINKILEKDTFKYDLEWALINLDVNSFQLYLKYIIKYKNRRLLKMEFDNIVYCCKLFPCNSYTDNAIRKGDLGKLKFLFSTLPNQIVTERAYNIAQKNNRHDIIVWIRNNLTFNGQDFYLIDKNKSKNKIYNYNYNLF
jgi:hypothetical protein